MSRPLDTAWEWYTAARDCIEVSRRLSPLWDELAEKVLGFGDDRLMELTGDQVGRSATAATGGLDDVAVAHIFAAFEAKLRNDTLGKMAAAWGRPRSTHPAVVSAQKRLDRWLDRDSVSELIDAYSLGASEELREKIRAVHQVREYRNWVSHGSRSTPPDGVRIKPHEARDWLEDFLFAVGAVLAD